MLYKELYPSVHTSGKKDTRNLLIEHTALTKGEDKLILRRDLIRNTKHFLQHGQYDNSNSNIGINSNSWIGTTADSTATSFSSSFCPLICFFIDQLVPSSISLDTTHNNNLHIDQLVPSSISLDTTHNNLHVSLTAQHTEETHYMHSASSTISQPSWTVSTFMLERTPRRINISNC